ncbi:MAG: helix-turn-helix domain-containing protein [Candidatus Synoicihabitans palmerolidicus]|nr:helix-turn-helix domain-containing protein [Candidatus Synoicihabitans palmerolidicus]
MQNIGERLEEARKRKGMSIREAAEATKIRGDYLHKYESNQFDINLPDIYVRGFLRNYASYLGLPAEKISNDYNSLGHGNPQTKSINREIYGRMDLTVASTKDSACEPDATASAKEGDDSESGNPATFKPNSSAVPYVDRALGIQGLALAAAVTALVLLIVFGVRAMKSSGEEIAPGTEAIAAAATNEPQIVIHAIDSVRIKVVVESTGEELFQGAITRSDSRSFPAAQALLLTGDPMQNIEVEMAGQRYPTEETGRKRIRIQPPE